jgi:hypothetical protein
MRSAARLQGDLTTGACDAAPERVHLEVARDEPDRLARAGRAADERLDPRQQLREGERLDQVVVRARLQAPDTVVHLALGRQEDDGRSDAAAARTLHEGQAVAVGQHDVDDGGVVGVAQQP